VPVIAGPHAAVVDLDHVPVGERPEDRHLPQRTTSGFLRADRIQGDLERLALGHPRHVHFVDPRVGEPAKDAMDLEVSERVTGLELERHATMLAGSNVSLGRLEMRVLDPRTPRGSY